MALTRTIASKQSIARSARAQLIAPIVASGTTGWTWTNMPAAITLLNGNASHVQKYPLNDYLQCRLVVNKQGTAGFGAATKLILRYYTLFSTTASDYLDIGESEVNAVVNVTNSIVASSWINILTAARTDVFIAVVGSGGDGIVDPAFGNIFAHFR